MKMSKLMTPIHRSQPQKIQPALFHSHGNKTVQKLFSGNSKVLNPACPRPLSLTTVL